MCPVHFLFDLYIFCWYIGAMGRSKSITLGGYTYHVLNRANGRLRIFRKNTDVEAFEAILAEAGQPQYCS